MEAATDQPRRDQAPSARRIVDDFDVALSDDARRLLAPDLSASEYLDTLLAADLARDARHFLAHALPRRRALWWACLAAWDVREATDQGDIKAAMEAVMRFIREPSEPHRRAAEGIYRSQKRTRMASLLAGAAYFSTGSIAPPHAAPIAPPPSALGRLVSTVVYFAAVAKDVRHYMHHMREYIQVGRQIASGPAPWSANPSPITRVDEAEQTAMPHFEVRAHQVKLDVPSEQAHAH